MTIVVPMFVMFALTFSAGGAAFVGRIRSVRRRELRLRDFQVLDVNKTPDFVARSTKHLANLFEMPVLFYAAALIALNLRPEDPVTLGVAWTYVALRAVHSCIHLTYNRVPHRLLVFMLSNLVLAVLWVRVLVLAL